MKFGSSMGAMVAVSRLGPVLSQLSDSPLVRGVIALATGFAAGMTTFAHPSVEVSMYMYSKALDAIFNVLVAWGWIRPIPNGAALLFSLMTGIAFYAGIYENSTIRKSYFRFLCRMSNGRVKHFEKLSPVLAKASGIHTCK
jgi:hypothetical protein